MSNRKLDVSGVIRDPWMVATSCSWRRILSASGKPVLLPTNSSSDGHPDLQAEPEVLQLMATAPELYQSNIMLLDALNALREGKEVADLDLVITFALHAQQKAEEQVY